MVTGNMLHDFCVCSQEWRSIQLVSITATMATTFKAQLRHLFAALQCYSHADGNYENARLLFEYKFGK